jgi:hypothetical protein
MGPFDVWKFPESKKTCKNKKIYFAVLQMKGDHLENP